ncbi:MAG: patatin-like phospholipase family protein, partial [Verrucomicrobiales bacterium]
MWKFLEHLLFKPRNPHHPHERPLRTDAPPRLGLALSSGGARGLAHVGVLQVLEENGIEIHALAGSSMGAYVGSLWAAGYAGSELEELAAEMHDSRQLWKLADPIFPPVKGLFRGVKAKNHLRRSLGDLKFEDLERELYLVTFDVDTRERLVLRSGSIADAVHASCAIPGIIAPVTIRGRTCADGGVVDPVPVTVLEKYARVDHLIAVSVVPTYADLDTGRSQRAPEDPPSWLRKSLRFLRQNIDLTARGNVIDTLRQSVSAAQIRIAHDALKKADLVIQPDVRTVHWHQYAHFEKLIQAGREAAREALPDIHKLLNSTAQKNDEKDPSDKLV